ncbi:glycosyltransferase family 4 protein [Thiohalocapsa marina]|uniref:Glycosyltransferase family 4 protein n=1 Tax=Thiohalocapsa marina TaxID=424902 RepID=A0A5M8FNF2_9GAMM|nr:glycosyltransferase family 4 protein [Thiohalocapsa marina]KAA6183945.1 glycosyltransferase family 4 protein [Thiohalocapsa marina]
MKIYLGFNAIMQDGMGTAALSLLKALRQTGLQVQPVHPWRQIAVPEYYEFDPLFITEDQEEPPLEVTFRGMVEAINSDPDCAVFSHFGSPNWAAIVPYLRKDIRVVVSVHSVTPSALKIALANQQRVSRFVAVSWQVENRLRKKIAAKDHWKISLVTNAIDVDLFKVKTTFTNPQDKIKIVYIGRVEDYTKGADKIPKIASQIKAAGFDFVWDVYGYFHWGYETRFYDQLKASAVDEVIHYKGCVSPAEIPDLLSQYDIMVMPSNHEGFGLSLVEAMAVGLTCVVSRLPDVTDRIIQSSVNGFLVNKRDINGFAGMIIQAGQDLALRKSIARAARESVAQHYSLRNHGERYRRVFEEAVRDNSYLGCFPLRALADISNATPKAVKSHILARLIPGPVKRILKRFL